MTKITVQLKNTLKGHHSGVYHLQSFDDGQQLLSSSGDGKIARWRIDQPELGTVIAQADSSIYCHFLDTNNNILWFGDMNGDLYRLDLTAKTPRRMQLHRHGIYDIMSIHDQIIVAGGDGSLSVWDQEFTCLQLTKISQKSLRTLAYDQNHEVLFIGSSDGNIYVVSPISYKVADVIQQAHDNSVFTLALSNHSICFSGGRDAQIKKWWIEDDWSCEVLPQAAHWYTVNDLVLSPDQNLLCSVSRDKSLKIWDVEQFMLLKVIDQNRADGHRNSVNSAVWITNELLATASDDHTIKLWEITRDDI